MVDVWGLDFPFHFFGGDCAGPFPLGVRGLARFLTRTMLRSIWVGVTVFGELWELPSSTGGPAEGRTWTPWPALSFLRLLSLELSATSTARLADGRSFGQWEGRQCQWISRALCF